MRTRACPAYFLDTGTAHCQSKRIGGHKDWRLASIKEMSTLLDIRNAAPALDPDAFPMAPVTQWFLVSTPFAPQSLYPDQPQSWAFKTTVGSTEPYPVGFDFPVRCVRDGDPRPYL